MIRKDDDDFILAIVDVVWTTFDGCVKLLPKHRRTIQSVQSVLRRFASRDQSVEERHRHLLTGIHAIQTVFKILQTHF